MLAERSILSVLESPFIVNLRGSFQDTNMVYMVMDFVPGGELFTLLQVLRRSAADRIHRIGGHHRTEPNSPPLRVPRRTGGSRRPPRASTQRRWSQLSSICTGGTWRTET